MAEQPKVRLRRDEHHEAEEEGDQEPLEALAGVLATAATGEREPAGRTGEEEEQRHVPGLHVPDQVGEGEAHVVVLHVELLTDVEDARRVEGEEEQHGEDAQP